MKVEHKIVKSKDYLAPIILGAFWIGLCFLLTYAPFYFFTKIPLYDGVNETILACGFTLLFCWFLYYGIRTEVFEPIIKEEVIHIIK